MIMLIIYNEFILYLFLILLVDPLTLTIVLSLFNFSSLSHLKVLFNINIILLFVIYMVHLPVVDPGLAGLFITSTLLHLE